MMKPAGGCCVCTVAMKVALILCLSIAGLALAKGPADKNANAITPTSANVAYGPDQRNVLDFWKAKSDKPAPLIVFIHGGGFRSGSKENYHANPLLKQALDHGISCAAINYRYVLTAPVQDILHDCARAVQFLRSKSGEWNIDKSKVAATGGSAGAGTSLWLATRDDLADPKASDPVLRESSRVCCAVLNATQATYDVTKWESFLGPAQPGFWEENGFTSFYHIQSKDDLLGEKGKPILHECDMLSWISKDDAPIFMDSPMDVAKPSNRGEWLHCTMHARAVKKALDAVGVEGVVAQDIKDGEKPNAAAWLLKHLQ